MAAKKPPAKKKTAAEALALPPRGVRQLYGWARGNTENMVALCNDGTIWERRIRGGASGRWVKQEGPPTEA